MYLTRIRSKSDPKNHRFSHSVDPSEVVYSEIPSKESRTSDAHISAWNYLIYKMKAEKFPEKQNKLGNIKIQKIFPPEEI